MQFGQQTFMIFHTLQYSFANSNSPLSRYILHTSLITITCVIIIIYDSTTSGLGIGIDWVRLNFGSILFEYIRLAVWNIRTQTSPSQNVPTAVTAPGGEGVWWVNEGRLHSQTNLSFQEKVHLDCSQSTIFS